MLYNVGHLRLMHGMSFFRLTGQGAPAETPRKSCDKIWCQIHARNPALSIYQAWGERQEPKPDHTIMLHLLHIGEVYTTEMV